MRTLLIDNHDSYTYNLFQLMAQVFDAPPEVLTNDDPRWDTVDPGDFDAIVVSPGPGHPARSRDIGMVAGIVRDTPVPLLGVCLGHQAIALVTGGAVAPAPRPRHGHLSRIRHTGTGLFDGLPQDFVAVRYHSLCVPDGSLPASVRPTAWSEDGVLMGLCHRERPLWGVQFHPESVASEHGARIIENFGRLAAAAARDVRPASPRAVRVAGPAPAPVPASPRAGTGAWRLVHRTVGREVDTAAAFTELFGTREYAFWLDSSRVEPGLSRFSYLGAPDGADGEVLCYSLATGLTVHTTGGVTVAAGSVFDALRTRLAEPVADAPDLPFDLRGGYVGYFGYELKAELGSTNRHTASTPDAVWVAATRMVVVDHERRETHVVALTRSAADPVAEAWVKRTARWLRRLRSLPDPPAVPGYDPEPDLRRARAGYVDDVAACQRELIAGESYEICLTNRVRVPLPPEVAADPLRLYLLQRRANPAPYAAFLRLREIAVLCSSPERFLRVAADRTVETKPIKGTAPRGRTRREDLRLRAGLAEDKKVRAENLMIVDLLRNDLGRVCEIGSVHVPRFMTVETYATVHQLVSTVRGTLRADLDVIDCVRACFPGGSMTGAPKLRTMEILDELEDSARGVFSGSIGFLSRGGTADLNIVIRTAVADADGLSVGAGGAIVLDSDPVAEFEEMVLKARAPLSGVVPGPTTHPNLMEALP